MTERCSWTDVRDQIRARILDRTYAPGDKLPRDQDIADEFGCARTTVHRAMQDLSLAGLVERKRKGGTHVRADPVSRATFDIPITRHEVEHRGATYGYELTSQRIAQSPPDIMARFAMTEPADMLHAKALHSADGRPYIFEDRWIDLRSCPDITAVDLTTQSANEWLVLHKPYSRIEVSFFADEARDEIARHLETPPGSALLVIERTTWVGASPITTVLATAAPGYRLSATN